MSLLQSPAKSLDQVEWYLNNRSAELFPGAFLLAAGSLSRQVLEQILFILGFYSGLPRNRYLKKDNHLRTAGDIIKALKGTDPTSGLTYLQLARQRGPRIAKFARHPRSLDKWRRELNEPSHFRNPAASARTKEQHIREFVRRVREILDYPDHFLITAAFNEIKSSGFFRAVLGKDKANTPGVEFTAVVGPAQLAVKDGHFSLETPKIPVQIVPDDQEVPSRWKRRVILVQHSHGMAISCRVVTRTGHGVDARTLQGLLVSFARTPEEERQLRARLKRLGFNLQVTRHEGAHSAEAT